MALKYVLSTYRNIKYSGLRLPSNNQSQPGPSNSLEFRRARYEKEGDMKNSAITQQTTGNRNSVRICAEAHATAKKTASAKGYSLTDYLAQLVREGSKRS
jgi:predicted DNA binding CopG/RHH family protein